MPLQTLLATVPRVEPEALPGAEQALVRDLAWASICGSFSGGVILASFALSLGATPLMLGLLAAIPFMAQAAQWPSTQLIEQVRRRRLIGVATLTAARLAMLLMAGLVLLPSPGLALAALVLLQVLISLLHAVAGCAVNSWIHQLIPPPRLGEFVARRLFWGTTMACSATLVAGRLVEGAGPGTLAPYGWAFAIAAAAGLVSCWWLARTPEPLMPDAGPPTTLGARLHAPLQDANFRRLLIFLGTWTMASNLAVPFVTPYLLEQLRLPLGTVTGLWVGSQLANALTLYLWGRLSDRLSNKGVLAVVLPLHFAGMLALAFMDTVESAGWQLVLLYLIHMLLGVAAGGIGLASGNIGLKLAPAGNATAYLAAIGLVCAVAGGVAPLLAGVLAQAASARELSLLLRWTAPDGRSELQVLAFAHWEFLFLLSALLGLYVMHALSRVAEGREVGERQVVQEILLEARRSLTTLSSVAGDVGSLFPFERLTERRKWWRERRRQET